LIGEEEEMEITSRLSILSIIFCALTMQALQDGMQARISAATSPSFDPDWSELNSSMAKMHAAMAAVVPSGKSDVDFVRLMLPHHQAAIDMAKIQLLYGKDPEMRRLAQEIITDQQSEIDLMQLWLKRHEPSK
jgi:uncharacterized protein (DUF305 family)